MEKDRGDIVIEIKVRLSGLTYDEAKKVRDALRSEGNKNMTSIIYSVGSLVGEISPDAKARCFSPWAEWRPARGGRK